MRAIKILGFAIAGLIALLVLVLLAVWMFVDPNDYKDRIAAAVQQSTGRSLSLPGKLTLSVFPWISLQTGEASLGNPAGFGAEPFLTLKRCSLSVKLLPLLHRKLDVGRIEIDGLDLRLKQNAAGKGNWEDWGSKDSAPNTGKTGASPGVNLAGVSISDGRIAFEDMVASNVKLDIGHVATDASIPVAISMNLVTAPNARPMPLKAQFELMLDLEKQRYQMAKLDLQGEVQPEGAPKPLAWKFAAPSADLNLAAQTLTETSFTAEAGAAKLSGRIAGSKLVDAPTLTGAFQLAELAPRDLMAQFGIASPVTRDKSALARFAAQGGYAWQGGVARMSDLKLRLDDSQLGGRFAYNTANGGMDFALTLDRIDLDRYQPPPAAGETAKSEPIELPVDLLKALRAKGSFSVGEIKVGGAHLTRLSAVIDVANAQARFAPLAARLYGGAYSGNIGLDLRQAVPRLTMDEHLAAIDIAALMQDYADSKRLSGRGNLDVKLEATGRNGAALLKTLNGTISTDLQNGAVEGVDIWYAIAQAQSLLQKRELASATNTKRTAFETFKSSADVVNGVATTKDLAIASQLLHITGSGSTNLVTQALDYSLTAAILKTPPGTDEGAAQLARASIPLKITGTLEEPKVRPDLTDMAKDRLKQEVEKRGGDVKEKVKNKLKGLFGK